jgi:galactose oxidase
MVRINTISILSFVFLFNTTSALNACPVTDTVFTGADGVRYRVCPDSDYTGKTQKLINNIASTNACAQLCSKSLDCFKAVYDKQSKICHFKGVEKLKWVANKRFDVIQAEQINIARCPYPETKATANGVSNRHQQVLLNTDDAEKIHALQGHRHPRQECPNHQRHLVNGELRSTLLCL